jgi:hypothetical protein
VRTPDVRRLEETYRQMTDEELLKLAEDLDSLTDRSKEVFEAELSRRRLDEATSPLTPVPAEIAVPDTPESRQLAETYRHMTDSEILWLASEMDTLSDEAGDVVYAEVCKRNLEEAVAGEAAEVPLPDETEGLVPSADDDSLSRRHLEKATSSPTPVAAEFAVPDTPELRQLAETTAT